MSRLHTFLMGSIRVPRGSKTSFLWPTMLFNFNHFTAITRVQIPSGTPNKINGLREISPDLRGCKKPRSGVFFAPSEPVANLPLSRWQQRHQPQLRLPSCRSSLRRARPTRLPLLRRLRQRIPIPSATIRRIRFRSPTPIVLQRFSIRKTGSHRTGRSLTQIPWSTTSRSRLIRIGRRSMPSQFPRDR